MVIKIYCHLLYLSIFCVRTQMQASFFTLNLQKNYNTQMGGVDHFHQLCSIYNVSWKLRKWIKIFHYFCIANSRKLYKLTLKQCSCDTKPLTHLKLRSISATQSIGDIVLWQTKETSSVANWRKKKEKNHSNGRPTIPNATKLTNVGNHLPEEEPTFPRYANCSSNIKETKAVQNTLRAQGIWLSVCNASYHLANLKCKIQCSFIDILIILHKVTWKVPY